MKATAQEERRAQRFLHKHHLTLEQIESFCFMQRHQPEPNRHSRTNLYGPGILTLQLNSGEERALVVHLRHHPTSLIHTLLAHEKTFRNYASPQSTEEQRSHVIYKRPSLYLFWYFVLFILCFCMGFYAMQKSGWSSIVLPILFFGMSLYSIYLLLVRFCYLELEPDALIIVSAGRKIRYTLDEIRKVNFDFARELNATHVMELLDRDYRYRLFYIGRVSRKQLNEITERLRQAGIDATCSLNDEKRHYHDVYHIP